MEASKNKINIEIRERTFKLLTHGDTDQTPLKLV